MDQESSRSASGEVLLVRGPGAHRPGHTCAVREQRDRPVHTAEAVDDAKQQISQAGRFIGPADRRTLT
jgi:hypothetical protein